MKAFKLKPVKRIHLPACLSGLSSGRLPARIPSFLSVRRSVRPPEKRSPLEARYAWIGGAAEIKKKTDSSRRAAKKNALLVSAAFLLLFALSAYTSSAGTLEELLVRPEEGSRSVSLELMLSLEDESYSETVDIEIVPEGYVPQASEGDGYSEAENRIRSVLYRLPSVLSSDSSGSSLRLPSEIDGVRLSWKLPQAGPSYLILAAGAALAAVIWFARDEGLKNRLEADRRAIEDELPSVVMQLSLMMNAGLVLSSAFEEVVRQYESSDSPMARLLRRIDAESRGSNESFVGVLYRYALASGIKDLIRFAGMMADQQGRGSELAEKLERERQQLWNARLSSAKGRSKTAETKLSFPLMLVLLSLVLISVGPALMEL